MYNYHLKRFLDLLVAVSVLVVLSPVFLILVMVLKVANNGAGAFFLQQRPGLDAKLFTLIKFKTMSDEKDAEGNLLPNIYRITKVGQFIRSTSLDEIPQLLNVIKGDMSIVGPRPLLVKYLPLYNAEQARRNLVKPGITGWAQVNGRNMITWEDKFKLDIYYVDNLSFWLDVKIIFLTIKKVLSHSDIHADGDSQIRAFTGNN